MLDSLQEYLKLQYKFTVLQNSSTAFSILGVEMTFYLNKESGWN